MPRHIAFLRGINLGKRRLPMSRLSALFEELGYGNVKTFIASGNVLFDCGERRAAPLERTISNHLECNLGYEVDVFIRKPEEVLAMAQRQVFEEDGREGATIHVGFFQQPLPAETRRSFAAIRTDMDEFKVEEREYFWLCRTRTSESKVWALPETRALRLPTSTMRNMSSIRKLVQQHLIPTQ